MKRLMWILLALAFLGSVIAVKSASAGSPNRDPKGARACRNGYAYPWHGYHYHVGWGVPVALVVPPTAENQTHWGWGVGNTRITPICPQFQPYPPGAGVYSRAGFLPTPAQPTDTDQFGVYYVRGPW